MSFLYDELSPQTKATLQVHLDVCTDCSAQVESWRRATHRLNDWRLLPRRHRSAIPLFRWAAAAALMALAAVGGTRLWALNSEVATLRAEMRGSFQRETEDRVRATLAAEWRRDFDAAVAQLSTDATRVANREAQALIASFVNNYEEKRLQDQQVTLAALQELQQKQARDHAGLRKELETVAVLTEAGLQRAQNQIASITDTPERITNNTKQP